MSPNLSDPSSSPAADSWGQPDPAADASPVNPPAEPALVTPATHSRMDNDFVQRAVNSAEFVFMVLNRDLPSPALIGTPVSIAGIFSNWEQRPMQSNRQIWTHTITARPGETVQFKFVAKGRWFVASNYSTTQDGSGNTNNMVIVRATPPTEELFNPMEVTEKARLSAALATDRLRPKVVGPVPVSVRVHPSRATSYV